MLLVVLSDLPWCRDLSSSPPSPLQQARRVSPPPQVCFSPPRTPSSCSASPRCGSQLQVVVVVELESW
ncbi:hypothetical protein Bca101_044131 [Brassica carinata]